ncbi:MAG: hypothetical protein KatS3mg110_4430 [Pirellulaceae bacterium]|nr:MAG: hypothetical protein KatS3mg110_4430 [Pirellulaceae bacterium]
MNCFYFMPLTPVVQLWLNQHSLSSESATVVKLAFARKKQLCGIPRRSQVHLKMALSAYSVTCMIMSHVTTHTAPWMNYQVTCFDVLRTVTCVNTTG